MLTIDNFDNMRVSEDRQNVYLSPHSLHILLCFNIFFPNYLNSDL